MFLEKSVMLNKMLLTAAILATGTLTGCAVVPGPSAAYYTPPPAYVTVAPRYAPPPVVYRPPPAVVYFGTTYAPRHRHHHWRD